MNKFEISGLDLYYGDFHALKDINLNLEEKNITAFIGPSGCGKSTLLKTLNRMNDLVEGCKITGKVLLDGQDIYYNYDSTLLRKKVGMVFQKPNPFPMSIYDNIAFGPRTHGIKKKSRLDEIVEQSLRSAAIWDELKDRLKKSALGLSGGQQQRLCIARALAVEPEVLLMDEPTSALDPISTMKIEDLAVELKKDYTIIMVTHNMQQAARISDRTAFFLLGEVIEYADTETLFSMPKDKRTEDYITGRFGEERRYTMRNRFDRELTALHDLLIEMGTLSQKSIETAKDALLQQDRQLARQVYEYEREVDEKEKEVERRCLKLLLQQQPVASDLRVISTALKIITDLERISDQSCDIAELADRMADQPYIKQLVDIPKMAEAVIKMVKESIDAFVTSDIDLAQRVVAQDDVVDDLFNQVKNDLIALIRKDANNGEQAVDLLMVAKYLERIGDHATNVAEWVVFSITGEHKNERVL